MMNERDIIYQCANVMREHLRQSGNDLDGFMRGALGVADNYLKNYELRQVERFKKACCPPIRYNE